MGHRGRLAPKICVVLDTNMLMMIPRGLDIFHGIEEILATNILFIIPRPVLDELEKLASNKSSSQSRAARSAIKAAFSGRAIIEEIPRITGDVDTDIALYAAHRGCFVATNDRRLRKLLRSMGVPDIHLREAEGILEASFIPPVL
jgi:rRNA-processing protein FCF1